MNMKQPRALSKVQNNSLKTPLSFLRKMCYNVLIRISQVQLTHTQEVSRSEHAGERQIDSRAQVQGVDRHRNYELSSLD